MKPIFKKLSIQLALCLAALTTLAATIVWYSDAPHATSISGTDLWAIQKTDPNSYVYVTLAEVAAYMGVWTTDGNVIFPATNHPVAIYLDKSTNAYNNLSYNANLFNSTNEFVSAFSALNSVFGTGSSGPSYKGSVSLSSLNGANTGALELSVSSLTNKSIARLQAFTNGVSAFDLSQDGLDVIGKVSAATYQTPTNVWAGATNNLDMGGAGDQVYRTFTPMQVSGLINKSNTVLQTVVMSFTNAASTNCLLTLAAGISIPQRTNQVAVSNASVATLTVRYHPAIGTNAVFVQF
jgi:hypothetical protein